MQETIDKYLALLDKKFREQKYQKFIEENTQFAPRQFVQNHGVHFSLLLRKLKISSDLVTDFVILSKSSLSWHYILIELEKPHSRYFKEGTKILHADFIRAHAQIKTWQSWFSKTENKQHFENQLSFLKKPIRDTPVEIKYVLVFGRRAELEHSNEKKDLIRSYETQDFKIMSFDGLATNASNNKELFLGIRKNKTIEILSEKLISMEPFHWCDESDFSLNSPLRDNILKYISNDRIKAKKGSYLDKIHKEKKKKLRKKISAMKIF